ncbi:Protein of unknown function [Pyronema omphalodes CBS 100304]|uniref:Uncharacterized protein n=1 Tax=Pyronema omphalodes (strain CBS 100304) TaxID=1076935 RepID=U4LWM3_PYROM|nr:Protein of unknown function [Pyronema omphalodes CBS 100304]
MHLETVDKMGPLYSTAVRGNRNG